MHARHDASRTGTEQEAADAPEPEGDSAHDATEDRRPQARTLPDEFKLIFRQFRELGEYFSYFVSAKTDGAKLSVRQLVIGALSAALGVVTVGGLIMIACWLLFSGLAEGLGELFGGRSWAGRLVTGLLMAAGLGSGLYYFAARRNRVARERTVAKYETRQDRQRSQFGRSVADPATSAAAQEK